MFNIIIIIIIKPSTSSCLYIKIRMFGRFGLAPYCLTNPTNSPAHERMHAYGAKGFAKRAPRVFIFIVTKKTFTVLQIYYAPLGPIRRTCFWVLYPSKMSTDIIKFNGNFFVYNIGCHVCLHIAMAGALRYCFVVNSSRTYGPKSDQVTKPPSSDETCY